MARIPILTNEEVDEKTKKFFEDYYQNKGVNSNLHGVLANNTTMMYLFNDYVSAIKKNFTLGVKTEKLIILLIASLRECDYCYYLHKKEGKLVGITDDMTNNIKSYANCNDLFSLKEISLLRFVEVSIKHGHCMEDKVFENLKLHYSNSEIIEIVMYIGLILTTTTINNSLDIELDTGAINE